MSGRVIVNAWLLAAVGMGICSAPKLSYSGMPSVPEAVCKAASEIIIEAELPESPENLPLYLYKRRLFEEEDVTALAEALWAAGEEKNEFQLIRMDQEAEYSAPLFYAIGEEYAYMIIAEPGKDGIYALSFRLGPKDCLLEENPFAAVPVLPEKVLTEAMIADGRSLAEKILDYIGIRLADSYLASLQSDGIHYCFELLCDEEYSFMEYPGDYSQNGYTVPDSWNYVGMVYNGSAVTSLYVFREYILEQAGKTEFVMPAEKALEQLRERMEYQVIRQRFTLRQAQIRYLSMPEDWRNGGEGELVPVWLFSGTLQYYDENRQDWNPGELQVFCYDAGTGVEYEVGQYSGGYCLMTVDAAQ